MAIDSPSELKAQAARSELVCLMFVEAIWWPLVALFVVAYSIAFTPPATPSVGNAGVVMLPMMVVLNFAIFTLMTDARQEELGNWRFCFRRIMGVLPFALAVFVVNLAASQVLQWAWEWHVSNRYVFIILWSFAVGFFIAACTYLLWRLLRSPKFRPKHASSLEP